MATKIKYQVCNVDKATKTAQVLDTISADSLREAVEQTNNRYTRGTIRLYPLVTLDDAESITAMARYTLASVEAWERRHNFSVLRPQNRSQWDREDYVSIATIAILTALQENPAATMYAVKTAAFAAITAEQSRRDGINEREYMPGWITCNITPQETRATYPDLDKLIREAVKQGSLSEGQIEALTLRFSDDLSVEEIAKRTNRERGAIYFSLYRAYYWTLKKAKELDGVELPTFKRAGYTPEDVDETLFTLRKRGKMNKNQK